jgi:hypothetical protein
MNRWNSELHWYHITFKLNIIFFLWCFRQKISLFLLCWAWLECFISSPIHNRFFRKSSTFFCNVSGLLWISFMYIRVIRFLTFLRKWRAMTMIRMPNWILGRRYKIPFFCYFSHLVGSCFKACTNILQKMLSTLQWKNSIVFHLFITLCKSSGLLAFYGN